MILVNANVLSMPLASKSVHMIATSPPYWNLRSYETGQSKNLELGQESLHDCSGWATDNDCGVCYVCHIRKFARECWRVLRDDGIMFLNLGDSYSNAGKWGGKSGGKNYTSASGKMPREKKELTGLKPKDLCMIPARVALALQTDGWYLRSDIIWAKPNPMPESVSDRCTKSHEYIFMLTKRERYFWDSEGVREDARPETIKRVNSPTDSYGKRSMMFSKQGQVGNHLQGAEETLRNPASRNIRSVWNIATQSTSIAHFATWPEKLVEIMIKAGSSEKGVCPVCKNPWERVTEATGHINKREPEHTPIGKTKTDSTGWAPVRKDSGHWRATCTCNAGEPIPATVLDPFVGSGTTALVARRLGRDAVGLDLSMTYLQECARERLGLNALDDWQNGNGKKDGASLVDLPMFAESEEPSVQP